MASDFGLNQINCPTPAWATNLFRIVLYIASIGTIAIGVFTTMPDALKVHIAEASSFITIAVHLFSKMWGVQIPDNSQNIKP
jgi:hypothetical protein